MHMPVRDPREASGADPLARVLKRRERHRRRPLIVRVLVALVGSIVTIGGLILVVPLPEAGLPLLAVGLGTLALEFDWAARALSWTLRQGDRLSGWFGSRRPFIRWLLVSLGLGVVGAVVLWLVRSF
jgi:uncharacterized protein (TIGR02611 family)